MDTTFRFHGQSRTLLAFLGSGTGSLGWNSFSPLFRVIRRPLPTISADTGNVIGYLIMLNKCRKGESVSGQ